MSLFADPYAPFIVAGLLGIGLIVISAFRR